MNKRNESKSEINIKEKITQRFDDLIEQGERLFNNIPRDIKGRKWNFIDLSKMSIYEEWLYSACNLIQLVVRKGTHYYDETIRLLKHENMNTGISTLVVTKMIGLLKSTKIEWDVDLLRKIEYVFAAETFDDFLDHAEKYHKSGKKKESAVLASAVLEDVIAKIAKKNNIEPKGKSLEPLINELTNASVFTTVKAKRTKSYGGTRTKVFHADWDEFDIKDVGEMIKGLRELIEDYL